MKAAVQAKAQKRAARRKTPAPSGHPGRQPSAGRQDPKAGAARPTAGKRIQVRKSGIHGRGVFALQPITAGQTILEYVGEVITWDEALKRHPHDPSQPDHTFYFHLDDARVIDGRVAGNASRWINHSCAPNCEADDSGGRVFIKALCDVHPGDELFFDYGLVIDERRTPALKKRFACHCGAPDCRGTLLAPGRQIKPKPLAGVLAKAPAEPPAKTRSKPNTQPRTQPRAKPSAQPRR